jgi:tRNA A37 threonylcarbamoyladenosine synthetase subunit TsaC/SUA5/YrdC
VRAHGRPITATRANRAGEPPARTAAEVRAAFPPGAGQGRLTLLDGGETAGGPPSTLVRVRGAAIEVLRRGAIAIEPK